MNTTQSDAADRRADLALLRDSVRRMLARAWSREGGRASLEAVWTALVDQGLTALGRDPELGGLQEALVVLEELGRASCPAPFLSSLLANLALTAREPACGGERVAVAFGAFDGDANAGAVSLREGRLNGELRFVEDMDGAERLLVFTADGPAACTIAADAAGVSITPLPGLVVPPLSSVRFENVVADAVPLAAEQIADLNRIARLGLAARALGAARRGFELVVEHARTREQFGQPIGRFQAIQHKLANSLISLDGCALQITAAAEAFDAKDTGWRYRASAAIAFAGQTLRQVALETQHVFGAIGYAEEHEAPGLFRRIHGDVVRHGGARRARAELAAALLDESVSLRAAGHDPVAAFRSEFRDWLDRNWTAEDRARNRRRPFDERNWNPGFARRLGAAGWTTLTWPREAGGQARTPLEQLAFIEEIQAAGAPQQSVTVGSWILGPEIIAHGSPELQQSLLPGIRAGEHSFGLGYSEPGAGSDLAALRTRAVRDGDDYVINGQKLWTTDGDRCSHLILAARTDPDPAKKHGGISLFVMPMNLPGVTVRPSMAFYGHRFCSLFFDDVRLPATCRLGPENGGWRILTSALASERVIMAGFATQVRRLLAAVVEHLRAGGLSGDPWIRDRVGELAAEVETARLLALRSILLSGGETAPLVEAAIGKVFSSELGERLAEAAIDMLGATGLLGDGAPDAPADGLVEQMLRRSIMMVVGGGTAEIQRTMIAQRGLGLPR
ncbi:MAG: acyl-CoA dehydrogenase [Steroidobacteraceae bacterium]